MGGVSSSGHFMDDAGSRVSGWGRGGPSRVQPLGDSGPRSACSVPPERPLEVGQHRWGRARGSGRVLLKGSGWGVGPGLQAAALAHTSLRGTRVCARFLVVGDGAGMPCTWLTLNTLEDRCRTVPGWTLLGPCVGSR